MNNDQLIQTIDSPIDPTWAFLRTHKPPQEVIWCNRKWYLTRSGYYQAYDGSLLHREVWGSVNGEIPTGHDIHHVDGDRFNNALSNLRLVTRLQHHRLHGSGSRVKGRKDGPGRPKIIRACPQCGLGFSSRDMRLHKREAHGRAA